MMRTESSRNFYSNIDFVLIIIYILLAMSGIFLIFSALYDSELGGVPSRFVSQIIWFAVSLAVAVVILLLDSKFIYIYSYHLYIFMLLIMISLAFIGKEVNGAKSWLSLGGFTMQPVEFMKIATALALSSYMSSYSFDIRNPKDFITTLIILGAPVVVILFIQNDTGSGLVFGSFLLMLYREGLNKLIYVAGITLITIFIAFFLLDSFAVVVSVVLLTVLAHAINYGDYVSKIRYVALLGLIYVVMHAIFLTEGGYFGLTPTSVFLISVALTSPVLFFYMRLRAGYGLLRYIVYVIVTIGYYFSVSYVFNNLMQLHQRKRVLDLLGIESDIFGWGYNVNQSKIAIGSGGFWGKGFLNGTQTKFNFVPEQTTDFIFCTVGEEFGFVGSVVVVLLFTILILRLMYFGDKIPDAFTRVYCYCVASIFLFHFAINVGMTIGIAPVIGIPLPFFSYGGSSLLAFTIMLSIALKLNMDNFEKK